MWTQAPVTAFIDPETGWAYCTSCAGGAVVDTGGRPLVTGFPDPAMPEPLRLATLESGRALMSPMQSESGCAPGEAQCVSNPRAYATQPPVGPPTRLSPVALRNPSNLWLRQNPAEGGCGCAACLAGYVCDFKQADFSDWRCHCLSCGVPLENPVGPGYGEEWGGQADLSAGEHLYQKVPASIVMQAADGSDRLFEVEYTKAYVRQEESWDPGVVNYTWEIFRCVERDFWSECVKTAWTHWKDGYPTLQAMHQALPTGTAHEKNKRQVLAAPGGYAGTGMYYRTWPRVKLAGASRLEFIPALKQLAASRGISTTGEWNAWFVPTFDSLFIDIDGERYPLTINAGPCGMCPASQAPPTADENPAEAPPGLVNIMGEDWGTDTGITFYQRSKYKIIEGDPLKDGVTVTESDFGGNVTVTKYNTAGQVVGKTFNSLPVPPGTPQVCLTEPNRPECQPAAGAGAIPWPTIAMVGGAALLALMLLRRKG